MFADVFIHTLKSRQVIQNPLAKITLSPVLQGRSFRLLHPARLNEQTLGEAFSSRSSWIAQTVLQPRSGEQLFSVFKKLIFFFVQTRSGLKVSCWTEGIAVMGRCPSCAFLKIIHSNRILFFR